MDKIGGIYSLRGVNETEGTTLGQSLGSTAGAQQTSFLVVFVLPYDTVTSRVWAFHRSLYGCWIQTDP